MSYLSPYLSGKMIFEVVGRIEKVFKHREYDFDTIAVRGNSGLLLGSVLAVRWDKDLIIVRKEERSHSGDLVEGWGINQKILIVDDFIESGTTVDLIYESLVEKCDNPSILGILLYAGTYGDETETYHEHPDGTQFKVWSIKREE